MFGKKKKRLTIRIDPNDQHREVAEILASRLNEKGLPTYIRTGGSPGNLNILHFEGESHEDKLGPVLIECWRLLGGYSGLDMAMPEPPGDAGRTGCNIWIQLGRKK